MTPTQATAQPFAIGLTGGIGSGKTTIANLFGDMGATIIDTDAIAHQLTAPGGQAIPQIRTSFGDAYVTEEGALDRARMRSLVFSDPSQRQILEGILHPLIRTTSEDMLAAMQGAYPIMVVPLLFESGIWATRVARVLVVDCPEEEQVARVMARNNLPEETIRSIMAAQIPRHERLARADDVIENIGDIASLRPQVVRLHEIYSKLKQASDNRHL